MSERHPLSGLLYGIAPFSKGMVIGSIVAGWLVCFVWRAYVFSIADIPASPFNAFLIWILFGVPALILTATVWLAAVFSIARLVSPWPLVFRSSALSLALGAVVISGIAIAGPLDRHFALGGLIEALALLSLAVAPFLMLRRG